ncbi:MAG TPA: hypothetical protein VER55_03015 [Ardenticatenaceae bacterium]|nr:hypothetical protein [Ardenticatenaceae bacterium]
MIADTPSSTRDNAARATLRSGARAALAETVRESAIDFTGLHRHTRWLGWLGYLIVVVLLGIPPGVELFGERLPTVEFDPGTTGLGLLQIPFLVLLVSSISFALGCAFILTGASDSRRRLFFPVVGLFLIHGVRGNGSTDPAAVAYCSIRGPGRRGDDIAMGDAGDDRCLSE